MEGENKKTVKCQRCGYIWDTSSIKRFISCPDCLTKVKNVVYVPNKNTKEIE